jgi:hypothetical protein
MSYGHPGQGGYGESQGAHAQSGHGRGGSQFAGHRGGIVNRWAFVQWWAPRSRTPGLPAAGRPHRR